MTAHETFIDTNILVYAHDLSAGKKHVSAKKIIEDFWHSPIQPYTSIQVLQECIVQFNRLKLADSYINEIIEDYLTWNIITNEQEILLNGLRLKSKFKTSFWDAMIVAAAKKAGTRFILSENFQHNRIYDGIKIINPFIS